VSHENILFFRTFEIKSETVSKTTPRQLKLSHQNQKQLKLSATTPLYMIILQGGISSNYSVIYWKAFDFLLGNKHRSPNDSVIFVLWVFIHTVLGGHAPTKVLNAFHKDFYFRQLLLGKDIDVDNVCS